MKIRGNVVGTNMKPEKVADRIGGGGGGITEEQLAGVLENYATKDYVEQNMPPIVESEIRNQYEPIAEYVISQLPVYSGEVRS